jgi:uncharacterized protein YbaA (DUF1428 family)
MSYVDGFVLVVPENKLEDYRKLAEDAGKIWKKHGAFDYKECLADDMDDKGFCATFPQTFKPKEGEVIIFSFIVYQSREHRDEVNAKVMSDPDLKCDPENMPFDVKRMTYGGFKTIVEV